jgi:hypothetical protein
MLLFAGSFAGSFEQAKAQVPQDIQATPDVYIDWQLSNQGCYGCASFYYKVVRRNLGLAFGNRYQFDIYFYSNSYLTNAVRTSTYVYGLMVTADGFPVNKEPVWMLFKEPYSNQLLNFTTTNPYPRIFITWTGVSLF